MGQVVAVANVLTQRLADHADTSTTSLAVGTGNKTFITAKFYDWAIGMWVTATSAGSPSNIMYGQVTSYNSATGALVVGVTYVAGTGTYSDWTIAISTPDVFSDFLVEKDSNTGSAEIPAGTTAQRSGSPTPGRFRFNSDLGKFEGYNGASWGSVGGGATGGGSDDIFIENGQTVTTNYTLTTNKNAGTFGPITVDSGVTVTVPSGSVWTIV
jgi:hypothetical protein